MVAPNSVRSPFWCFTFAILAVLNAGAGDVSAEVKDLPANELGGRFQDQTTNLVWLDVSNFLGRRPAELRQILDGTAFRLARKSEVEELFLTLNAPSAIVGTLQPCGGQTLCNSGVYDDETSGINPQRFGRAVIALDTQNGQIGKDIADDVVDQADSNSIAGAWVVQLTSATCGNAQSLDFDCDGIDEKVVWRRSTGTWYVRLSRTPNLLVQQWGLPGDYPIAGDYDGDGIPDLAVWRPESGVWFIRASSGQYSNASVIVEQFGLPGDIPIRIDNDGDGSLDLTVWRPSEGNFYFRQSSDLQIVVQQWGLSGDIPIAGARK